MRLVDGAIVALADTTLSRAKKPEWMRQYEYDQVPATLTVRELRASGKTMVTTFLDPKETAKREVAAFGPMPLARRSSSTSKPGVCRLAGPSNIMKPDDRCVTYWAVGDLTLAVT